MTNKVYKPGFFCALFWVISWAGMFCGIAVLFINWEHAARVMWWSWGVSAGAAIISYIIRAIEKSSFDGRWSWHWFD
ncbi:MAG: hypothetical protein E7052_00670 [Lentisphaerae bacterium]|nr:hypothetical protein [Lentisphaerota bacterium]